jgi:hypothetical protein
VKVKVTPPTLHHDMTFRFHHIIKLKAMVIRGAAVRGISKNPKDDAAFVMFPAYHLLELKTTQLARHITVVI